MNAARSALGTSLQTSLSLHRQGPAQLLDCNDACVDPFLRRWLKTDGNSITKTHRTLTTMAKVHRAPDFLCLCTFSNPQAEKWVSRNSVGGGDVASACGF